MNASAALQQAVGHHQAGRLAEAEKVYRQVLAVEPSHPDALHLLGLITMNDGRLDEAQSLISRAIEVMPSVPAYRATLDACHRNKAASIAEAARILVDKKDLDGATKLCDQALALVPDSAEALNVKGAILRDREDVAGARAAWIKSIQANPSLADPHNNLGTILVEECNYDDAIAAFKTAIKAMPEHPEAHVNLAMVLMDQGRVEEARKNLEFGLLSVPESSALDSALLFLLQGDPSIEPEELFTRHRAWASKYCPNTGESPRHTNNPDPHRRLRIGYVSGDFREHVVMKFARVLFTDFSPERFETYCFSNTSSADEITAEVKSFVNHWHDIKPLSEEDADRLIRQEQIDILVDLSGHTGDTRLKLFARKPAPVQVTYLGYPDTTGLPNMDYRLTDNYADPPGLTERFHSEELVRLPSTFLCFDPRDTAEITWSPGPRIIFGSFNALRKINDEVIATWAKILEQVPDSQLLVKANALRSKRCTRRLTNRFASHGIGLDRLILRNFTPSRSDHLQMHNEIDIALDPFPYNGTATSCDVLSMGVPIITLAGQTHRARVGVSLLSNLGTPELIAPTRQAYVQLAVDLANDLPRIQRLRAGLRDQFIRSPLVDRKRFMADLEAAYRGMWERWCGSAKKSM